MNTRLQVEHPVTEWCTGSTWSSCSCGRRGSAARPRVIGDDRTGTRSRCGCTPRTRRPTGSPRAALLTRFDIPGVAGSSPPAGPGLRVDAGLRDRQRGLDVLRRDAGQGDRLGARPARGRAQLAGALARARLHGVTTNRDLLVGILRDPAFLAGTSAPTSSTARGASSRARRRPGPTSTCCSPRPSRWPSWTGCDGRVQAGVPVGWRNVVSQPQRTCSRSATRSTRRVVRRPRRLRSTDGDVRVLSASPTEVRLEVDGVTHARTTFAVAPKHPVPREIEVDGPTGLRAPAGGPALRRPGRRRREGSLLAPMPGTVVAVAVEDGADVDGRRAGARARGDEDAAHDQRTDRRGRHRPRSPVGQQVAAGDVLAVVDKRRPARRTA